MGLSQRDIVSGAGHDAAFLSQIAPAAMLFVPSRDGMSHCAQEWTDADALAIIRRGASSGGLTWHFAPPPVLGLDFEMDVRGVAHEFVI